MTHEDHIQLIRNGLSKQELIWADFGSGDGAFTLALREIIGPNAEIYSIDTNIHRLNVQKDKFAKMFPGSNVHFFNLNFQDELPLPSLDGILMANSLHYIYDKEPFLTYIKRYLKSAGKLIIVEYNAEVGNIWVPFPVTTSKLIELLENIGFINTEIIDTIPSDFLTEIYAVVTRVV